MEPYESELKDMMSYASDLASYISDEVRSDILADGGANYEHLNDIPDGAGCTEIWEKLSEERDIEEQLEER